MPRSKYRRKHKKAAYQPTAPVEEGSTRTEKGFTVYQLKKKEGLVYKGGTFSSNNKTVTIKIRFMEVGEKKEERKTVTVLVVGETRSGKSTLLNGIVNTVMKVPLDAPLRYELVPSQEQTKDVTVYDIFWQPGHLIDYNLRLIDTPGFGDPHGEKVYKTILETFDSLFAGPLAKKPLNCIAFVDAHSSSCDAARAMKMADCFKSRFADSISKNIVFLATHTDDYNDTPQFVSNAKAKEFPCRMVERNGGSMPLHFCFSFGCLLKPPRGIYRNHLKCSAEGVVKFLQFCDETLPQTPQDTRSMKEIEKKWDAQLDAIIREINGKIQEIVSLNLSLNSEKNNIANNDIMDRIAEMVNTINNLLSKYQENACDFISKSFNPEARAEKGMHYMIAELKKMVREERHSADIISFIDNKVVPEATRLEERIETVLKESVDMLGGQSEVDNHTRGRSDEKKCCCHFDCPICTKLVEMLVPRTAS